MSVKLRILIIIFSVPPFTIAEGGRENDMGRFTRYRRLPQIWLSLGVGGWEKAGRKGWPAPEPRRLYIMFFYDGRPWRSGEGAFGGVEDEWPRDTAEPKPLQLTLTVGKHWSPLALRERGHKDERTFAVVATVVTIR